MLPGSTTSVACADADQLNGPTHIPLVADMPAKTSFSHRTTGMRSPAQLNLSLLARSQATGANKDSLVETMHILLNPFRV